MFHTLACTRLYGSLYKTQTRVWSKACTRECFRLSVVRGLYEGVRGVYAGWTAVEEIIVLHAPGKYHQERLRRLLKKIFELSVMFRCVLS